MGRLQIWFNPKWNKFVIWAEYKNEDFNYAETDSQSGPVNGRPKDWEKHFSFVGYL